MLDELAGRRLLSSSRLKRLSQRNWDWSDVLAEHDRRLDAASECWKLIYWIEIPLRNSMHVALEEEFGPRYWTTRAFAVRAGRQIADDMSKAPRQRDAIHQFPSDLSLGVWVRLLSPRISRHLWEQCLKHAFLPNAEPDVLFAQLLELKGYRNAIAHHELSDRIDFRRVSQLCISIAEQLDDDLVAYLKEMFD